MTTGNYRTRSFTLILVFVMLFSLCACNFPGFAGDERNKTPDADMVKTQIAGTLSAQDTLTAQAGEIPTTSTMTTISSPTVAVLTPGMATTVVSASTPIDPTSTQPIIRADVDTNCRLGPSTLYPVVGYLLVGQESSVHGRNSDQTWWHIATPKKPGTFCWAWGRSTRVQGDTSQLPVITPPPPPTLTPTAGNIAITAMFSNVHLCSGTPTAIFQITNTGSVTIESVSLVIENRDISAVVYSASSNAPFFSAPSGCPPGASALTPGGTAYVGGSIGLIPTGTNMHLAAQLCSGDNLSGDCLVYDFNWGIP